MKRDYFILLFIFLFTSVSAEKTTEIRYKNPTLTSQERAKDLLNRMTLEEKFWQMFMIPGDLSGEDAKENYKNGIFGFQTQAQGQSDNAAGQLLSYEAGKRTTAGETAKKINEIQRYFVEETRLGIPIIAFDEALHGLIRGGATAFPQSIGMAATFNPELIHKMAEAIAMECKSRGIRDILSPVVNIANDVRWGRTEETYGEDPFLSSKIGVAFVSAFEKNGVVTSPKHFIANVADGGRDSYPVYFNERQLREIYLPPFVACFKEGGSRSVMTSYNSLDGTACSSNSWLLRKILKEEIGFQGFVISDAGAVGGNNVLHFTAKDYAESTKQAVEGGLDVIFQTAYNHYPLFFEAYEKGMIDPAAIDEAVLRVLKIKFDLGLFEEPYVREGWAEEVNHCEAHQQLNAEVARESFVLLKNEKQTLPLDQSKVKSIALIGYDIHAGRLGGYSGPGTEIVSILSGVKSYLKNSPITINYAEGVELHNQDYVTIPSNALSCVNKGVKSEGLWGEYFSNSTLSGTPEYAEVNKRMSHQWTLFSPNEEKLPYDCYSIRWTGKLTAPVDGTYRIGATGNDGYRIYIDNKLVVDNWKKVSFGTHTVPFQFEKGKTYNLKVEYYETIGNARFNLVWNVGVDDAWKAQIAQAVEAAQKSDVAIVTGGIHEGEFQDRGLLSLPGKQIEMIEAVAATGKPVVVLLVGGSAILFDQWGDKVESVMHIWYPGDKGGHAVADVLFGAHAPSGKLPITFPVHEGQLPLVYNHRPTGRGDDYYNLTGQPLFPFGYGLSYSEFAYSDLKFDHKTIGINGTTTVRCTVKNIGKYAAAEVVQLYIRDVLASVSQPVMQLKGFEKILLKPGEEREVSFEITPEMLKIYDQHMQFLVEPGDFRIMIGSSSKDIRLRDNLTVVANF
ncbi:MAG: glycoside hydrolase family 3 N-terminal domain-containing protein [Phocaeicola sp.]